MVAAQQAKLSGVSPISQTRLVPQQERRPASQVRPALKKGNKARHRGQDDDETSSQSSTPFIVQGDGSHQPLVNDLGDVYSERDSRQVFTVTRAPTPTPVSKASRAASIGTKNLFCKWTKSRPQDPKTSCWKVWRSRRRSSKLDRNWLLVSRMKLNSLQKATV